MANQTAGKPELPENLYWKGSKIYYVVSHNGIVAKASTGTDDIKKAVRERDRIKAKMVMGDKAPAGNAIRIPELLDDYLAHLTRRDENKGQYKTDTAMKTGSTLNR